MLKTEIVRSPPEILLLCDMRSAIITARSYWNETGVCLIKGHSYRFEALGNWTDSGITCTAAGFHRWWLQPVGKLKRVPEAAWFELIGSIERTEPFRIGESLVDFIAPASGYLFCFANDVSGFYWNNKGSVVLVVEDDEGITR